MTMGDHREMDKTAAILKKHDQTIAGVYAQKTGKRRDGFLDLMAQETWMTADEAKGQGLVDDVLGSKPVEARWSARIIATFNKAPDAIRFHPAVLRARLAELEGYEVAERLNAIERDDERELAGLRSAAKCW
jgi:ClpP protease-like protein